MAGSVGPVIGAAAAAAARQRLLAEEEEMTHYSTEDLNDDWEFKIVRANTAAFGNPAKLRQLQEEEARAGWVMVEKFDNSRVRFKRPASARAQDTALPPDVDPYRVYYGISATRYAVLIVAIVFALVAVGIAAMFVLMRTAP
jgi:hypothetical protein